MGRARVPVRREDVPPRMDVVLSLDLPTRAALQTTDREDAIPPHADSWRARLGNICSIRMVDGLLACPVIN